MVQTGPKTQEGGFQIGFWMEEYQQPGIKRAPLAAAAKHDLDLRGAFLVGDRWSDVRAAQAAGCRGVLIATPFSGAAKCAPDHTANDITLAVDWILATAARGAAGRTAA